MDRLTTSVWLIDDDPLTNFIHSTLLNHYDASIEVKEFSFAGDALNALKNEANRPDLIFLDINMPEIDGWDFLDSFQPMKINTRLIMVSSSIYIEDIKRAKSYEAVENFVSKPLTIEHLTHYIPKQQHIKL
ncbi:MAG: response regulator [Bacteroidota bacterium]